MRARILRFGEHPATAHGVDTESSLAFIDTHTLSTREPKPGWHGRFFESEDMSFALYRIEAGASLHEHAHPNEEVWNVVSGELEITIGAEVYRAGPGCAALVPPNTAHSVRALRESEVIVVDSPLRGEVGGSGRAALSIAFDPFADASLVSGMAPLTVGYVIENFGRGEAALRSIELECAVARVLPAPTRTLVPSGALPERIVLPGGERHRAAYTRPALTPDEIEQLRQGDAIFYLRGVVLHEDATGERHHTTFCRVLDATKRFVPPEKPGYNYGD